MNFDLRTALLIMTLSGLALNELAIASTPLSQRQDVQQFIAEMVERHQFEAAQLNALFNQATIQEKIITAIKRPAEAKPWYQYRTIFVQQSRIDAGVSFWDKHADTLARAEQHYGVPAAIVTAILGVETRYGEHRGHWQVLDALTTLAFDYPPRSKFFRSELEQYLLLTREEGMDPLSLKGSYAGAMGQAQFISSSFRHYAADFDGDGKRDLWDNTADAIGSVANYLSVHGWKTGQPIASRAEMRHQRTEALAEMGIKPHLTIGELRRQGVAVDKTIADDLLAAVLELETENGREHWVGMHNFYVITRYNHSPLYAMAVYQLSEEIRTTRNARLSKHK